MAEDVPSTIVASRQAKQTSAKTPTLAVSIVQRAPGWKQAGVGAACLRRAARLAFGAGCAAHRVAHTPESEYEVTLLLSDDGEVRSLNRQWRGKDKPTNVLSFPATEAPGEGLDSFCGEPCPLGDIVLALETLQREAAEQAIALDDHAKHLVVHGVLHLLGFDHEASADAAEMEALETEILGMLGVADPYREPALADGTPR
jgi:probable rRNA maturation factor